MTENQNMLLHSGNEIDFRERRLAEARKLIRDKSLDLSKIEPGLLPAIREVLVEEMKARDSEGLIEQIRLFFRRDKITLTDENLNELTNQAYDIIFQNAGLLEKEKILAQEKASIIKGIATEIASKANYVKPRAVDYEAASRIYDNTIQVIVSDLQRIYPTLIATSCVRRIDSDGNLTIQPTKFTTVAEDSRQKLLDYARKL